MHAHLPAIALAATLLARAAAADPAEIITAEARRGTEGWHFSVTLRHGDTGWEDYADGWRVVGADGTVYGTRELLHPHVNEQPFTRSLAGVAIPDGVGTVFIEARTLTTGWDAPRVALTLPE